MSADAALPARLHTALVSLLAAWMGERYYRTFRPLPADSEAMASFDALLAQRELRVGVTTGVLWEGAPDDASADAEFEQLLSSDIAAGATGVAGAAEGGYALWTPPGGAVPREEPRRSEFRLLIARGLSGLDPAERRELRIPVTLRLAQVDAEGAYVSVAGGLAAEWLQLSEGVSGSYHLDSNELKRLPEQAAELEIILSRVRDRAAVLEPQEVAEVAAHDYWLVSRLPDDDPPGLTVIGAPPDFDATDGATVRRLLRAAVQRATAQRRAREEAGGRCDLSALVLAAPLAHMSEERVTAALRGMNPTAYAELDLIAIIADGQVRQVLKPRALPWQA